LFAEAGEIAANVSYGFPGTEAQLAYAVTDHLAVMTNVSAKWSNSESSALDTIKQQHFFGEAGVGYFLKEEDFRTEIFGGFGMGKSLSNNNSSLFDNENHLASGIYNRIFIQPSISTNENGFNVIFTPRISWVNFRKFSPYPQGSPDFSAPPSRGYKPFFEPSLTGRFPLQGIFLCYFQLGINLPFDNYDYNYNYSGLHLAVGLQVRTSLLYKDGN
jgi:hypothetical protein